MKPIFKPLSVSEISPEEQVEATIETPIEATADEPVNATANDSKGNLPRVSWHVHNPLSVYVIACLKLVLDALLIFLFYDKLKEWKVMGEAHELHTALSEITIPLFHSRLTFPAFGIICAMIWGLIYLLILTQVSIRNKTGYLLFAFLFVFDSIFLMQPTKDWLMVLCSLVVFTILRQNTKWRYLIAGALFALFSWFYNPYLLAIIPLFVIVLIWRKSEKWGMRAFMFFIVLLAAAYQFSKLTFLPYARPETNSLAYFNNIFSDDDISPHISFYLINYAYVLLRILLPFELLVKGTHHSWVFILVQLGSIWLYLKTLFYLIGLDWKNLNSSNLKQGVQKRDLLTQDALLFVFGFLLVQAIYEPDYGQVFRHMMGCLPFYLYLLFGTNKRAYIAKIERDFTGKRPLIFFHKGNEDYVYDVLQQAGKVCGAQEVILLGDESNQGFTSNWYSYTDYCSEELEHFRTIYRHINNHHSYQFELTCFERHFVLYEFCVKHGISECLFSDSDVLLYRDLIREDLNEYDFGCASASYPVLLGEVCSPHIIYWKLDRLRQFLDFVIHVYSVKTDWLEEVSKRQTQSEDYPNGDISDMILLTAWRKIVDDYDASFRFYNFDRVQNGVVCDHNLTSADNYLVDEYQYRKSLGIKKLKFRKKRVFLVTKEGELVEASLLHCQNTKDYFIPLLARHVRWSVIYWFMRIGNKLTEKNHPPFPEAANPITNEENGAA